MPPVSGVTLALSSRNRLTSLCTSSGVHPCCRSPRISSFQGWRPSACHTALHPPIHPPVGTRAAPAHPSAAASGAAVDAGVQAPWGPCIQRLWAHAQKWALLAPVVILGLISEESSHCSPQRRLHRFTFPPAVHKASSFSTSPPPLVTSGFLSSARPSQRV